MSSVGSKHGGKFRASYDFSGATVLVTGASKGIGRQCSLRLAAAGCKVGATARSEPALASLAAEIRERGGACEFEVCDLDRPEEIGAMVSELRRKLGPIEYLVNNAGITFPESVTDTTLEHWDTTMNVNLRAPFLVSQAVLPDMIAAGRGAIVNVSSLSGVVGFANHGAYCASKFGLHGLSKVMALELGPVGIRVNCVAPTVVLTPMGLSVWGDPEVGDPMKAKIPLGTFVKPDDVADAVLFLLSDSASLIHGEVLMVDGGYSAQ